MTEPLNNAEQGQNRVADPEVNADRTGSRASSVNQGHRSMDTGREQASTEDQENGFSLTLCLCKREQVYAKARRERAIGMLSWVEEIRVEASRHQPNDSGYAKSEWCACCGSLFVVGGNWRGCHGCRGVSVARGCYVRKRGNVPRLGARSILSSRVSRPNATDFARKPLRGRCLRARLHNWIIR